LQEKGLMWEYFIICSYCYNCVSVYMGKKNAVFRHNCQNILAFLLNTRETKEAPPGGGGLDE